MRADTVTRSAVAWTFLIGFVVVSWGFGASPVLAQPSASNFEFGQINWYDLNDVLQIVDSSWGTIEFDCTVHPSKIYYVNVVADAGAGTGPVWIVENLPLFPDIVGNVRAPRLGVDFDITLLGIPTGADLPWLDYYYTVTADRLLAQPVGPMVPAPVDPVERISSGSKLVSDPLPADVGVPEGYRPSLGAPLRSGKVKNFGVHFDIPEVQEGNKRCLAGAFARSIKWLDQKHKLGIGKTGQEIYQDLVDKKVGSSGAGSTTYEQDIKTKSDYLKEKSANRGVTKVLDLANAVGPVEGVKEETGKDLLDWLKKEMPTEDVELHYDNHIITVAGYSEVDGTPYVVYRDDEKQGDNSKGDKARKIGRLRKNADGSYSFRAKLGHPFFKVKAVVSESISVTVKASSTAIPTETRVSVESPIKGETHSDVVLGSLTQLRLTGGDLAVATMACLVNDTPSSDLLLVDEPPPDEGFWFVQRSTNKGAVGSYGSLGLGQVGERDEGINASPAACPACDHDICLVGDPLEPACNDCVFTVCQSTPECCEMEWHEGCVELARFVCNTVRCAESRGTCSHTLCYEGEPLVPGCDVPPLPTSCVVDICAMQPECCDVEWHAGCVDAVEPLCGLGCW